MRTLQIIPCGAVLDCRVVRVIDGDTLVFHVPMEVRGRLDGIQAAESNTPKGKVVADMVREIVLGRDLPVTFLKDYKYGNERMVRVELPGEIPNDLGLWLVNRGLAVLWDGKGPRPVGMEHE